MEIVPRWEAELLRALSTDSRASITELTKLMKCSRASVSKWIDRINKKYDLRYTLEIDEQKAGISERHLIAIKFSKKPDLKELKRFFTNDEYTQEVFLCEGDFDLLIYARATDPVSYIQWETYLSSELSEYEPIIKPSEFVLAHFGFFPLDDRELNAISIQGIDSDDKALLKLLNNNSRMSYVELSKATGMEAGTARYRLFRLKESGIIKRFTVTAQAHDQKYAIAYFVNYRFNKTTQERSAIARSSYMNADGRGGALNTFQMLAPISGSYRFFALALFDSKEEAIQNAIEAHKRIFNKERVEIVHAGIAGMLKGLLPFRSLDVKGNYLIVKWK